MFRPIDESNLIMNVQSHTKFTLSVLPTIQYL